MLVTSPLYFILISLATTIASTSPLPPPNQAPLISNPQHRPTTTTLPSSRRICDPSIDLEALVARSGSQGAPLEGDDRDDNRGYLVEDCEIQFIIMWRQLWTRNGDDWTYGCDAGEKSGWQSIIEDVRRRETGCGRAADEMEM
jgi:hypothetical protein